MSQVPRRYQRGDRLGVLVCPVFVRRECPPRREQRALALQFKDKTPARTERGKNWHPDYENLTKHSRSLVTEVSGLPGSLGHR